jgi:very-short-patch-repair endonuclease
MSLPEVLLWRAIRRREPGAPKFRRQHPAGPWVLDFYCDAHKLCVEVDGESHSFEEVAARDRAKEAWLAARGVRVLRFPAKAVLQDLDAVARAIHDACGYSPPD